MFVDPQKRFIQTSRIFYFSRLHSIQNMVTQKTECKNKKKQQKTHTQSFFCTCEKMKTVIMADCVTNRS